jgi:ABC-2 type transport system permease protein
MQFLRNIVRLTWKEFISLRSDTFMVIFILYSFTFTVYSQATGVPQDLVNASIAVVDEDNSQLSHRIRDALLPPLFQRPVLLGQNQIEQAMNSARFTFVLDIPPDFERDVTAGRSPTIQVLVDATAMMQAGLGASYLRSIIGEEIAQMAIRVRNVSVVSPSVTLQVRPAFNQGMIGSWFRGTMGMLNNITMLAVLLAGAALLREREHGTLEHLLVMPVTPIEIMLSKIIANGVVIVTITAACVYVMLKGVLGVAVAGSIGLFLVGTALYLFFAASLGICLGTIARSMPQLGLMFILLVLPLNLLSGANTPVESMPEWMQNAVQVSPATHFVALTQAILFRGAGLSVVWPQFVIIFAIGGLLFAFSFARFRSFLAAQ